MSEDVHTLQKLLKEKESEIEKMRIDFQEFFLLYCNDLHFPIDLKNNQQR